MDKSQKIPFIHCNEPNANQARTVWGHEKQDLAHVYSDRLLDWDCEGGDRGRKRADSSSAQINTVLWWEEFLKGYLQDESVQVVHVLSGCNWSSGYQYAIFGYETSGISAET